MVKSRCSRFPFFIKKLNNFHYTHSPISLLRIFPNLFAESSGEHEGNGSAAQSDVNANTFDNATNQHIMISYQWDNQQMAKRIADYLKGRGFKVWIDIYEMKGYIMDDMATAVENSALLLVCLSRRYKNSPNTRRGMES